MAHAASALSSLLDQLCLHPRSTVHTAAALTPLDAALVLSPDTLHLEGSTQETQAWTRWVEKVWGRGRLSIHESAWDPPVLRTSFYACVFLLYPPQATRVSDPGPGPYSTGASPVSSRQDSGWAGRATEEEVWPKGGQGGTEPRGYECCLHWDPFQNDPRVDFRRIPS